MLKLVRSGYKTLILETPDIQAATEFISEHTCVVEVINPAPQSFEAHHDACATATDKHVFLYLVSTMKAKLEMNELKSLIKIEGEIFEILMQIVNHDSKRLISKSRMGPGIIIMKLIGDENEVINLVKEDFEAKSANMMTHLNEHSQGTVISFTKGDITKPVSRESIHPISLHTDQDFKSVIQALRLQNLKYLNAGLHNEDWYELKIKIYDAYGHFDLHYKRLAYVLEKLDLGLILGESWGTDAATIFLSVGIYKVRFFTFYNPIHIKRILVGLEFLDDGTRVVDYDLYLKRRKIHWDALRDNEHKFRDALSHKFRQEIYSHLTDEEAAEMHEMEREILKSRESGYKER